MRSGYNRVRTATVCVCHTYAIEKKKKRKKKTSNNYVGIDFMYLHYVKSVDSSELHITFCTGFRLPVSLRSAVAYILDAYMQHRPWTNGNRFVRKEQEKKRSTYILLHCKQKNGLLAVTETNANM